MMSARPYAVFDIDGTLVRWQLYHALGDQLVKDGVIDKDSFQQVHEARMAWKRRSGDDLFRIYEKLWVKAFDKVMPGLEVSVFERAAASVVLRYRDQVHTYTRDLIADLKQQGYMLFAISGSPSVLVDLLCKHHGFDDFRGTEYLAEEGKFTGEQNMWLGRKDDALQEMVAKHGAKQQGSVAVGDSEGDIPMLSAVEKPIAFNPNKALLDKAKQNLWPVVIERKNVIYKLEPKDGVYLLAEADA